MMPTVRRRQRAQRAGERHQRRILIAVGAGDNQPGRALRLRGREPEQRRAERGFAVTSGVVR